MPERDSTWHDRVQYVFDLAKDIADPQELKKCLFEKCGDDSAQRQEVESLLSAYRRSDNLLEKPAAHIMGIAPLPVLTVALDPATSEAQMHFDKRYPFLEPPQSTGEKGRLGRYRILDLLGEGGMGFVFKAQDPTLLRVVALKVMLPAQAANDIARKRFIREAQTAAAVKNHHVITIHEISHESNPPWFVMEFVQGPSLQEWLDERGRLEPSEILAIGIQTAEGLAAAHENGLIHRDIKPANILLAAGVQVIITDFGLARHTADDAGLTQAGTIMGTPYYMAPEQARGEKQLDQRCDLYSLGAVLYRMATGRPPFPDGDVLAVCTAVANALPPTHVSTLNTHVPPALANVIMRLLSKDMKERYVSASEVAVTLKSLGSSSLYGSLPTGRLPEINPTKQPKMRVLFVGGLLTNSSCLQSIKTNLSELVVALVKSGHDMVLRNPSRTDQSSIPVDEIVYAALRDAHQAQKIALREGSVTVIKDPRADDGFQIQIPHKTYSASADYRIDFYRQILDTVDIIIGIGGQAGLLRQAMLCEYQRKPVFFLPGAGGTADLLWNEYFSKNYQAQYFSPEQLRLLRSNSYVTNPRSDYGQATLQLIQMVHGVVSLRAARDQIDLRKFRLALRSFSLVLWLTLLGILAFLLSLAYWLGKIDLIGHLLRSQSK